MHPKLKWLILIQLLLSEQALCRTPLAPPLRKGALPGAPVRGDEGMMERPQSLLGFRPQPVLPPGVAERTAPVAPVLQEEDRVRSAQRVISTLGEKLRGQMEEERIRLLGNASCADLLSATTLGDPSPNAFPQELLGLSLVPVLVMAGCRREAQTLVLRLYDLLGEDDAEELLMEVESLIEWRSARRPAATPRPAERAEAERHLSAVMFNIQQLAVAGEAETRRGASAKLCTGWTRVNGTTLLGQAVEEEATWGLEEAVRACESLGSQCAGVSRGGPLRPAGQYQAVLKQGSRIVPSQSSESESWIRQCHAEEEEEEASVLRAVGGRARRSLRRNCVNKSEEQVYNVMEWIPAVSTLYNLGTAVYYASVNCSETAKERAILSAVDLGTDALMAFTGGAAGVAGYTLGAGVKTGVKAGVKYLLTSMKMEDDLLVNQDSWEDGVITIGH